MHPLILILGDNMKRFETYLSEIDVVPEKYIPITEIFSNPKYKLAGYTDNEWVIGKKTIYELRRKTFYQTRKKFHEIGSKSFALFWNGNIDGINELGLNEFFKLSAFRELSSCMICFEEKIVSQINKRNNRYVSFGILKSNYEKYSESLRVAYENGDFPKPVNLYDPHKRRLNDLFNSPKVTLKIDGDKRKNQHAISIYKTDLYYRFEKWCKDNGKNKKEGLYAAMQALLKDEPTTKLENPKNTAQQFSSLESPISIRETGEVSLCIKIPALVYDTAMAVIRRFNSDPNNISKKKLSTSLYAAQAIADFNQRVPLKYIDPIAYKEYLEIKEIEKYNENKTKGGE